MSHKSPNTCCKYSGKEEAKEDQFGHKINSEGTLVFDDRCKKCLPRKEEMCPMSSGNSPRICEKDKNLKCAMCRKDMTSPTWDDREREKFKSVFKIEDGNEFSMARPRSNNYAYYKISEVINYWLGRLKAIREECRAAALKEVIEKIRSLRNVFAIHKSDWDAGYIKATEDIITLLSSFQELKDHNPS